MELKKEHLVADKEMVKSQMQLLQGQLQYIDGLIAFLERPEAEPVILDATAISKEPADECQHDAGCDHQVIAEEA